MSDAVHRFTSRAALTDLQMECRDRFDELTFIVRQLGALLLAEVTARHCALFDYTTLDACRTELAEASDRLHALPIQAETAHFHHHLTATGIGLAAALRCFDRRLLRRAVEGDPLGLLRHALSHLDHAARLIPGMAIVDVTLSCCAEHKHSAARAGERV